MKSRRSIIANRSWLCADCLRAVAVRLCLALVLALLVVPGYVVAPVLFAKLPTLAQAGQIAGVIFHIANRAILLLLIAVALFWRGHNTGRWRWVMLGVLLLLCGINEFVLAPHMQSIKDAMGPIDALPKTDPQRTEFGMWHGISELLHMAASLMAAGLVGLGWNGRRDACQS
jgi:Domain of unknown function (DUF4149)